MDILIKNMEMPKCCFKVSNNGSAILCQFYDWCRDKGIKPNKNARPKDCPLVEVREVMTSQDHKKKLYMEV